MIKLALRINGIDNFEICLYTTNTLEEMDKYTTEKFIDEQDILSKYKKKIQDILDYCDKTKHDSLFVITDTNDKDFQRQVLYKKYKRIFKQIIKNERFVLNMINNSQQSEILKGVVAPHTCDQIDRLQHINKLHSAYMQEVISRWRGQIRSGRHYHENIRKVLNYYKSVCTELNFPSFDEVYKQYLEDKKRAEELKNELEEKKHPLYSEIINRRIQYESIPKGIGEEPEFIPNSEEYDKYLQYLESLPNEFNSHSDYEEIAENENKNDDYEYSKIFTGRRKK